MAKKKDTSEETKLLKEKVRDGKVVVGKERVLKALRKKGVVKVFVASNCPAKIREDLEHYADLVDVPLVELDLSNEELGIFCKKNFFVSVVGIGE